jgi:3',5'-cyclic AMP phosphodiesterase CpdA
MSLLIHLSDLHFGPSYVPHLGELVLKEIETLNPDVVVVSGDLTFRARDKEFLAARSFLDRIPKPYLTIPGNHDQTLFNPLTRLVAPVKQYENGIRHSQDMSLEANSYFIVGLNDNRPILPGGFWSGAQRDYIQREFARAPFGTARAIATHHQMMWEGKYKPAGFWYPARAFEMLARCGVELVLNGHTHIPGAEQTREGIVVSRASTATCTRTRQGEGNSYNLIAFDQEKISITIRRYDERADKYIAAQAFVFPRRVKRGES